MQRRCHVQSTRLRLEPLEDRTLMSACHVVRLADLPGGHDLGNGHARGSLRYCINFANNNPGPDTIDFKVTGTIQLASVLPGLSSAITLTGPGADLLTVSGQGVGSGYESTIFSVLTGATVSISGLTIANFVSSGGPGGVQNRGTLTLKDCTMANNVNYFGDPNGSGGGIGNKGTMTISGTTVSGNIVKYGNFVSQGAGIYNDSTGLMLIENSTISGNRFEGGLSFENYGAGIYNEGSLEVRFSTVTNNDAHNNAACASGWGIYNTGSYFHLYDSIVAGNTGNTSCGGDDLDGPHTGTSNLIGGDPMLGPLQYNGGHTQTHAVLPGSPALDAGDNTDAPDFDQRGPGFPRIVNGTIDIGAYEVQSTGAPKPPSGGDPLYLVTIVLPTTPEHDDGLPRSGYIAQPRVAQRTLGDPADNETTLKGFDRTPAMQPLRGRPMIRISDPGCALRPWAVECIPFGEKEELI